MDKKPPSTSYASKREQELLLELYEARKYILEDKKTEFSMKGKLKKAEAWQAIEKEYNLAALGPQKNIAQLKRMWQHMKGRAKKEYVEEKKEVMRTGGGPPKPGEGDSTNSTIRILSTISQELESCGNSWDSDALPSCSNSAINLPQLLDEAVIIVDPASVEPPLCAIQPARPTPPVPSASPSTTQPVQPTPLDPPVTPSTTRPAEPAPLLPHLTTCTTRPAQPAPSTTQPAHPASSASTPYTRKRKFARTALTPQEEYLSMRQKEHEIDMKIKEVELKLKEADLILKNKDIKLKDADLQMKELELKIKEKEYLIKEIYLENISK